MKNIYCLICFLILNSCAFGQKTNYSDGYYNITMPPAHYSDMALGVEDRRPYVIDDSHSTSFTGILRSLNGIPYSMHTTSNQPLAHDLATLFIRSLEKANINTQNISIAINTSRDNVISEFKQSGKKGLLFVLNNWKTDSYFNTTFVYDVVLQVLDENGNKLAESLQKGETVIFPPNKGMPTLGSQIETVLNSLLNDREVANALKVKMPTTNSGSVKKEKAKGEKGTASTKSNCSAEKILKLQKAGLPESEILEVCK